MVVKFVFKFFAVTSCLLIFRALIAEPLLDGADFDYGEYLSGQCLTCHKSSSDEGIPAINGAEALYIAERLVLYKNKETIAILISFPGIVLWLPSLV